MSFGFRFCVWALLLFRVGMPFAFMYLCFIFGRFFMFIFCVLCCFPRRRVWRYRGVFAFLRVGVIAEGDGDDESFSERACHCKYLFTFHFRAFHAMLVACLVRRVCRRFFRIADFLPRLELFFGRYFIFENATHLFFLTFFLTLKINDFP